MGAVTLLAGVAPAAALGGAPGVRLVRRSRPVNVTITGALTVSWSSDPARGCAAAGLCGVTGSLEMLPGGTTGSSGGPPPLEPQDQTATVRELTRSADGAPVSTCAAVTPLDFTLAIRHTPQGLRAVMPAGAGFLPPSSGPCAGPTGLDLQALALPARRVGAHSYELSGTTAFPAGSFDVTVASTLRALVTYGNSSPGGGLGSGSFLGSGSGPPQPRMHRALQETADVEYRIQPLTGSLTTQFSGLASPYCAALGACGANGRLTEDITVGGSISFTASRFVDRVLNRRAVLRDLRSGRLRLDTYLLGPPAHEATSETLAQADGTTCRDSISGGLFAFQATAHRGRNQLTLSSQSGPSGNDPLRTRCPGPPATQVIGGGQEIAAAPLATSALGRAHLTLSLSGNGTFSGLGWAGTRAGRLVLRLTRIRERAATHRVQVFSGQPGVTLP